MDTPPPPPPPPPPTPTQSSPPVNWDALDALVLDFARSDRLLLPPASPSPPSSPSSSSTTTATSSSSSAPSPSSSYRSRLLIRRARTALEEGDVDAALALLRAHAPAALLDHRLLFHLHKQRFVELVRRGTEADREAALDCLRTALAPCALDAYPVVLLV
uniref:CTLH domain-containing protein n=1 Tax=Oryza barthii TaxID=65489 RepID=A0A0D3HD47_9ORYZ